MRDIVFYILDGHTPVPCGDDVWATWMFKGRGDGPNWQNHRVVAKDTIGDANISTVFLGIDHNYFDDGPPILFETMIFGGTHDGEQWRYRTWDEAETNHLRLVEQLMREDLVLPQNKRKINLKGDES